MSGAGWGDPLRDRPSSDKTAVMGVALSIRGAREEDAPLLAAAERAIASVPGRLASRPDEIDDRAVRKKIVRASKKWSSRCARRTSARSGFIDHSGSSKRGARRGG
jgi:hypothetical protein